MASTPLYRYLLPFAVPPHHSQIGIIFHSYLLVPMGEEIKKGSQKSSFLEINAKEGENIKPKAKGPHHQSSKNLIYLQKFVFPIDIL
jgi:hypothetical protein